MIRSKIAAAVILCLAAAVQTPARAESTLPQQYVDAAREMDSAYSAAGTRVDIAGFDLDEIARQGGKISPSMRKEIGSASQSLKKGWQTLEDERQRIACDLRLMQDAPAGNTIKIENLGDGTAGDSGFFTLKQVLVRNADGTIIPLKADVFKGGAFAPAYSYQCEPSPAESIYGRRSTQSVMLAGFDASDAYHHGATIAVSGLDQDKPGVTPIRITLDGIVLFEGPNEFKKDGWSEKVYQVPDAAWNSTDKQGVSATPEAISKRIATWKAAIESYAKWGATCADKIDILTKTKRAGLVWKKRSYPTDWWKDSFIRGICFESDSTYPKEKSRFPFNFEYVAKAFDSIGINMIYCYPTANAPRQYDVLAAENDKLGTPVLMCNWEAGHRDAWDQGCPDRKDMRHFTDDAQVAGEAEKTLRNLGGKPVRGITIDEPRFHENEDEFANLPEVREAFQKYLQGRREVLNAAGVVIPGDPKPILAPVGDSDRVLWTEWQYFKMDYLSKHYSGVADLLRKEGYLTLPVIQDYLGHNPMNAPYPAHGARQEMISTDLYNNGAINEAFGMDLLRSVSKGKAYLVTGAGYSCKTPDRFRRSLLNSMLRSDGVIQWIYEYASKYRTPYFFMAPGALDDQGKDLLESWKPEYWGIQDSVYRGMRRADKYLAKTSPTADIGVLYSMRSVIAESYPGESRECTSRWNSLLTFNALVDLHRPVEASMVEGLTSEKLRRFHVLYLMDAPSLSPSQCEVLREWVKEGGILVAGGNVSSQDEWGRPQTDYALSDIFGLHLDGMRTGVSRFTWTDGGKFIPIEYDSTYKIASVKPESASIVARWEDGSPAMLHNTVGKGSVYFLTTAKPGYYSLLSDYENGRFDETKKGFPDIFRTIATEHGGRPAVEFLGVPSGLEVQIKKQGDTYIAHLLDWRDGRSIAGLQVRVNIPGRWEISYPMEGLAGRTVFGERASALPLMKSYRMLVLKPIR